MSPFASIINKKSEYKISVRNTLKRLTELDSESIENYIIYENPSETNHLQQTFT